MRNRECVALVAVLAGLVARPVGACLWDRDTLDHEARGLPDVVQVITGRFERNPPLFYQMRLERVQRELGANPGRLDLYDDAAVACDRLGRDDEAIAWMAKKRRILSSGGSAASKDARYRYYANLGTFYAHLWIRNGARTEQRRLLTTAAYKLEAALAINPDAHFGRERYQLFIVEVLNGKRVNTGSAANTLGNQLIWTFVSNIGAARDPRDERARLVTGLCGLIVLGNAWESPDIFEALSRALGSQRLGVLAYLSSLRADELLHDGRESLIIADLPARIPDIKRAAMVARENESIVESQFHRLRDEANHYQAQRSEYMLALLKRGRHPDTDSRFWSGWHDAGPPSLSPTRTERAVMFASSPLGWGLKFLAVVVAAAVAAAVAFLRLRRYFGVRRTARDVAKTGPV